MDWKSIFRSIQQEASEENLSFEGNGGVSVPIANIMNSARVQEQVETVRQIEEIARQSSTQK